MQISKASTVTNGNEAATLVALQKKGSYRKIPSVQIINFFKKKFVGHIHMSYFRVTDITVRFLLTFFVTSHLLSP